MSDKHDNKSFPVYNTDKEAEDFVTHADLSDYDFSAFQKMSSLINSEYANKDAQVNLRLPQSQLDQVKQAAQTIGMPYTRLIRQFIDHGIQNLSDKRI